jgi:hypothetical protein
MIEKVDYRSKRFCYQIHTGWFYNAALTMSKLNTNWSINGFKKPFKARFNVHKLYSKKDKFHTSYFKSSTENCQCYSPLVCQQVVGTWRTFAHD